MKLKIYSAITACIFLFAIGSALAQENEGEVHSCNALFVSNAAGMAFDGHILTMKGIDRTITYFCDRPVRFAGQMSIEEVRELVSKGDNNFNDIPPNAALSIFGEGGKITTTVLHLMKPIVKENEIKYPVKVLLGKLPKTGGASTMFIDVIGAPVTPGSVAGVKRRTRRRTAAVATSASKTAAQQQQEAQQQQAQQQQQPTATESVEDRLRTLDKLAAGGYITKQEYDARKKSILDSL